MNSPSHEWFGSGSRIIITSRDTCLLKSRGVDQGYEIPKLDENEALELFSWHAFKQSCLTEDFARHSKNVITYSGRLPLALEVLGSYLSGCEITEWPKILENLKCIPHDQVQKILGVSFDGLEDVRMKEVFLDIACFFIGNDQNDVNWCGFFADTGIKVLVERSLITVDNRNKFRMHELLIEMGRQISFEQSPFDPEKCSRLGRHKEVFDILLNDKGTEAIKGLSFEFPLKNTVSLNTKAFTKRNKLRLLQLADGTSITKVPFSIVKLKNIGYIYLCGFEGFPSLIWSWMSPSNNLISRVKNSVSMSSLGTFKDLLKLRILSVNCVSDLQQTQYVARFLDVLKATNRQNLEASASSNALEVSDMRASPLIDDSHGQCMAAESSSIPEV